MEKEELLKNDETVTVPQYANLVSAYQGALQVVDDIVLKNYISNLTSLEIIPLSQKVLENNIDENVLFFKINEMVYEKNEFVSYKFASVFNALATTKSSVFIMIDSDGVRTDFYMGIKSDDEKRTTSSLKDTLENAMSGQFPGMKTTDYTVEEIKSILGKIKDNSISAVSCVANSKENTLNKNEEFVQGLEKLVLSMRGQKYTGIIIANTTSQEQVRELRKGYESVYTQLSPFAQIQMNYGKNSAFGKNESTSDGTNQSRTETKSNSHTQGTSETISHSESNSVSEESSTSKGVKGVATASAIIGAALAPLTGGASLVVGSVISAGLGIAGQAMTKTNSHSTSSSETIGTSESNTYGTSQATTEGNSHTYTYGTNVTKGISNAMTLTAHDKTIEDILVRIDKQLKRMDEFESLGMYECAAYFLSDNQYAAEMAASNYKAIVGGENSGVEVSAINSWGINESGTTKMVGEYVKNFMHPVFHYNALMGKIEVTPCSMVSGNELAIHMGLPRKSVCGFPVIEHSDFGKEVVNYDGHVAKTGINLGKVFNMGSTAENSVFLDRQSLSMHTFVTGSTGSGKSNTIYEIVRQSNNNNINFMIIEPAKGEYKHVFGNRPDVHVYGSNPEYSDLLKINPFAFSKGIHVLEHIDRLTEIFNVCWPMYAAMPAVLKAALLKSYEDCGWDFTLSKNKYDEKVYPTFMDLQESLVEVINGSAYSEEVKSNYMGSLVTRVKSLTNGLNGQIFTPNEIDNNILFEKNVIVDISRIGSAETKSLIMGLLIMRLGEHRISSTEDMNVPIKHLTVLEEAHNILKRTSTEQNPESPSVAGKSVEMISNAIAEMRTYGEGFVIVDQSPSAVDISAIRNTNTKIIMRLPDESDRRLAGKSAGLKDEQLEEIAKLPKGVAVVYQNDWVDPVLCKIQKYKGKETQFQYEPTVHIDKTTMRLKKNLLGLLLKTRVKNPIDVSLTELKEDLTHAEISSKNKLFLQKILNEYEKKKDVTIMEEKNFEKLSIVVSGILDGELWVKSLIDTAQDFNRLTEQLVENINKQVIGMSGEYNIAISQCLLRAEAAKSETYKEIYASWITKHRNKEVL